MAPRHGPCGTTPGSSPSSKRNATRTSTSTTQALRLANKGFTPLEAAELLDLPEELDRKWYSRGHHNAFHHDVRAVFTKGAGHVGRGTPFHCTPTRQSKNGEADGRVRRSREDPR